MSIENRSQGKTQGGGIFSRGCDDWLAGVLLCGSVVFVVVLFSVAQAAIEWRTYTDITYDAELVSETLKDAYDGTTPATRTTIGIGEVVLLHLDVTSDPTDVDQCRPNPQANWVDVYDTLQGPFWELSEGNALYYNFDTDPKQVWALKPATDTQFTVRVWISDSTTPEDRDDEDWERTRTFDVIVPTAFVFVEEMNPVPVAAWQAVPLGPPDNVIGGGVQRMYKVTPQSVNFDNVTFFEEVPEVTIQWNDQSSEVKPGVTMEEGEFQLTWLLRNDGQTYVKGACDDTQQAAARLISKIAGSAQSVPDANGFLGWVTTTNPYYTKPFSWVHSYSYSATGALTMGCSPGSTSAPQGPWQ